MNSRRAHLGGLLLERPLGGRDLPRSRLAVVLPIIACLLAWSYRNNVRGGGIIAGGGRLDVVHAVSGAVGSALSISVLYPLETVRTRLQVGAAASPSSGSSAAGGGARSSSSLRIVRDIGAAEGLRGLYRGWFSLVVALMALNFVYFYCFIASKRWTSGMFGGAGSVVEGGGGSVNATLVDLMAGYLAGVVAVLITGPLWLGECRVIYYRYCTMTWNHFPTFVANRTNVAVNTRLKLQGVSMRRAGNIGGGSKQGTRQQYTGIFDCLRKVANDEGIGALWQGTFTSIILALNPAIQFGVYEALKRHNLILGTIDDGIGNDGGSLGPFVNSFLAKFIATIVTYPIQVLQTRDRAGIRRDEVSSQKSNVIRGLFRGLDAKLLQTCLTSGIMFVSYEKLVRVLTVLTMGKDNAGV